MSSTDQRVQVDHLRIWIRQMSQEIWRHVSPRHKLLYSRTRLLPKHPRKWLWLEVQHRFAMLQIDRHRVLMVHDQPLAVALTAASRPPQPETGLLATVQGSASPAEARGECHAIGRAERRAV